MQFYTLAFVSVRDAGNNTISTVNCSFPMCLGQYQLFINRRKQKY